MLHPFSIFGIGFILSGFTIVVAAIIAEIVGSIPGDWQGLAAALLIIEVFVIIIFGMLDGANRWLLLAPPPAIAASILLAIAAF